MVDVSRSHHYVSRPEFDTEKGNLPSLDYMTILKIQIIEIPRNPGKHGQPQVGGHSEIKFADIFQRGPKPNTTAQFHPDSSSHTWIPRLAAHICPEFPIPIPSRLIPGTEIFRNLQQCCKYSARSPYSILLALEHLILFKFQVTDGVYEPPDVDCTALVVIPRVLIFNIMFMFYYYQYHYWIRYPCEIRIVTVL